MSPARAALALLCLAPLAAAGHTPAAPGALRQEAEESEPAKYLRLAREGRPVVRPQAARRLVELGAEALPLVRAACGEDGEGLAALGNELVAVLGEFGDARLRAQLWGALDDRDFPWRPAAARTLAATADASELSRFQAALADPIARVREAGLDAVRALDARVLMPRVRLALTDPDDRVRRRAAALLFDWGEPCALHWLVEDLARSDRFFALRTGELARYEAADLLTERIGELPGYEPRRDPADEASREALAAVRAAVAARCDEAPELPPVARAGSDRDGDVLGLELRSCRRGEYYLRWNVDDTLLVGTGNPARVALEPGTTARLVSAAQESFDALDGSFWGDVGCDLEQFHWQPDAAARPRAFRVNKGPEAVADLRPAPLSALARTLVATLPDAPDDDPRLDRLASRVRDALAQLGGPLEAPR